MKYLSTYLFAALFFIALTAGFNWLTDPFGMYWSPSLVGINEIKPEAGNRSRITKAYRANVVKPHILLVGNSRVEMGLAPNHPLFNNQPAYNQGMPGASARMQYDYALNVIAVSPDLHTLIIGVDFLDFLIRADPAKRIQPSPEDQPDYWPRLTALSKPDMANQIFRLKEKSAMLFSLDAIGASVTTLAKQSVNVSSIDAYGFNTAQTYLNILQHEGIEPLYIQKLEELNKNLRNKNLTTQNPDNEELTRPFFYLKNLLDNATERGISVYLFISPYHYSYLQLLAELNYSDNVMSWKNQLVNLTDSYPPQQVQLWDFSTLNKYTLEPVPVDAKNQRMKWYWEPAHYKKELGDLVLERMLSPASHSDFGIRLSKNNIKAVIKQDYKSLDASKAQWVKLKSTLGILQPH